MIKLIPMDDTITVWMEDQPVLIDEEDLHFLSGNLHINQGYVKSGHLHLHRLILGRENVSDGLVVDHINDNSLDNRKSNLQLLTVYENLQKGRKYVRNVNQAV